MTPTDCSVLRVYAPLRSALNVRPLDAQRPTILPLYSYSMGPLVSPAGSVVAKRVPLARSNPLHTNIGACKESIAPLASKLAVEHGFLHWSHKCQFDDVSDCRTGKSFSSIFQFLPSSYHCRSSFNQRFSYRDQDYRKTQAYPNNPENNRQRQFYRYPKDRT